MVKRVIGLMAMLIILAVPAAAVAQETGTPEAAARAYIKAMQQNQVDAFIAMMHPEALAQFKKMMLPLAQTAAKKGKEKELMVLFMGVKTAAQLEALPPAAVFKAFYKGLLHMMPHMAKILAGSQMKVLGHVNEGPDLAHVVYRAVMKMDKVNFQKLEVISLKKYHGKWMVMLSGNIQGIAAQLKQQMSRALGK